MDKKRFACLLRLIAEKIAVQLADDLQISNDDAIEKLYLSELWGLLEEEETKLWHLGPNVLCDMLKEELTTGNFTIPEGV